MDFDLNRNMSISKLFKNDASYSKHLIFGNETYMLAGNTRISGLKEYHSEKSRLPSKLRNLGHHRWKVKR